MWYEKQVRSYLRDLSQLLQALKACKDPTDFERLASLPLFRDFALEAARRMGANAYYQNARTWRTAAMRAGRSRLIYESLQQQLAGTPVGNAVQGIVRDNANMISSLPLSIARQLTQYIARRAREGARPEQIKVEVSPWVRNVSESRLRLICRTETAKSATALNRARSAELGVRFYQWSSVRDIRVRTSHRFMEGVVCSWDNDPNPEALAGETPAPHGYAPGCIWNCRCEALSVISLDELSFPIRFHDHGRIVKLTRAAFRRMSEPGRVAA